MRGEPWGSGNAGSSPTPQFWWPHSPCCQNWDCNWPHLWPESTSIPGAIWPSRHEAGSIWDGGRRMDHHDLHLSCEETEAKTENRIYSKPGREEAAESGPKCKPFSSQPNIGSPSHCVKPWSFFKNRNQPRLCLLARVSAKCIYWPMPTVIRNPFCFFYNFLKISH